jgi:hypothetical protein
MLGSTFIPPALMSIAEKLLSPSNFPIVESHPGIKGLSGFIPPQKDQL